MKRIGGYELGGELSRGAAGVVYRGVDPDLGRAVAVKVVRRVSGDEGQVLEERFTREGKALARLRHANIVRVHTAGREGDVLYLVMDLVPGESLEQRIARAGPLPVADAARIASQLSEALVAIHAAGLVHRDVKPANVVLTPEGQPILVDFGLVGHSHGQGQLTRGLSIGTPSYWAPEQAVGNPEVGSRADVYGLGATLYAMLVGEPPVTGKTLAQVIDATLNATPTAPSTRRPEVDSTLDGICMRCLEKEASKRYTALRLGLDLERYQQGVEFDPRDRALEPTQGAPERKTSRWWWVWLTLAALILLLAGAALAARTQREAAESVAQEREEQAAQAEAEVATRGSLVKRIAGRAKRLQEALDADRKACEALIETQARESQERANKAQAAREWAKHFQPQTDSARWIAERLPGPPECESQLKDLFTKARAEPDRARRIEILTRALKIRPNAYLVHWNLAVQRKGSEQSLEDWNRALALAPYATGFIARAEELSRLGRRREAISDLTTALNGDPTNAKALYNRGTLRLVLGDTAGAVEDLEKALSHDPTSAYARRALKRARILLAKEEESQ